MARLPTVGGDPGNWGTILNTYLSVSLASDGTINSTGLGQIAGAIQLNGTLASRPTATSSNTGYYYLATDVNGGTLYQSTGSTWIQVAAPLNVPESAVTNLTSDLGLKAPLASPTFTGTVTVPTPVNSTDAATKGYTDSGAQTLTNKRITKRIATLTDAATVTPDTDNFDGGKLTTLSQATTIANPTGTPTPFQQYILRIKSASAQTLTFGAQYRGGNIVPLPAATTGSNKTDYFGFQWNADSSTWDCIAISTGY